MAAAAPLLGEETYTKGHLPTTYPLEAISTTFGGPTKRKAVVSLADLYVGENHGNDPHSFAFGNTILSSNRSTTLNSMNEHLIGPLTKRQALESNEFTIASGHQFSTVRNLAGTFPNTIIGGDGKPIGPLTGGNHRATSRGGAATSATFPINGETPAAVTVDWMRQRDEVFSILEDMAKTPPNASDETKPYRCTVPGCDKSYKNANGLKYHNQHGHSSHGLGDADSPETRPYICTFLECGKRYKNLNGLKYHIEHTHPNLIAALKAHQAALMTNMNPLLADGSYVNHQAAAMTIAAALAAIGASSMMAMAANAVLAAHAAAAAATAAATSNSTATSSTRPTLELIGLPTVTSALQEPNSTAEQ
ncbi:Transcriptional regulator of ribosomal biogenesis proteins [Mortierella sp. AD011]|nr:Transcriptional regulator of ribosomal biogenesis proteins [Mortierella sp. AD010]KAF9400800.1 Transcriptional regulator of ribosomal biogenesis proteins [Mortierella sp. AD011]